MDKFAAGACGRAGRWSGLEMTFRPKFRDDDKDKCVDFEIAVIDLANFGAIHKRIITELINSPSKIMNARLG